MLYGEIIKDIYELLYKHYGSQRGMFSHPPFRMMLTAFLKDSAPWDSLVKTLGRLDEYSSPDELCAIPLDVMADKLSLCDAPERTARILNIFLIKLRTWGYLPEDYASYGFDELRALLLKELTNRKSTVDFMLLYAFDFPICAVNSGVEKLLSRIDPDSGWDTLGHEGLSKEIAGNSGGDILTFKELSMLLLRVTKEHCFAAHPACRTCPLLYMCASAGEF